ncbi:MAG: hypothetical protein KC493_02005 [Bacteriovoracaceae bacterium]|nr:hypothetical protein [Bacteriovoracaceae bacterium]
MKNLLFSFSVMELAWVFGNLTLWTKLNYKYLILLFLFSFNAFSEGQLHKNVSKPSLVFREAPRASLVKFPYNKKKTIDRYLRQHKKFFKKMCRPGTEQKFWNLNGKFRGSGFYVPGLPSSKLDILTVNRFIPELERKKKWIETQAKVLNSRKRKFKSEVKKIEEFKNIIKQLLEYKGQHFESTKATDKEKARIRSKYLVIKFKNDFQKFLKKVPFLLTYRHPNDHFDLRLTYDNFKGSQIEKEARKANEVYFYRKIVQDGASGPGNSRSDTFMRTSLDTIVLELRKENDFLTENLRYDLAFALNAIEYHLEKGKKRLVLRLNKWAKRVGRMIDFYKSLKANKVKVGDHFETGDSIVKAKDIARLGLKRYSYQKQADSYNYWKTHAEWLRAMFSIETILYNEVGSLDGPSALERKDVAQVVINRTRLPQYFVLPPEDSIHKYLSKSGKPLTEFRWLNVLFKESEFSFTYYFIHGNLRIYCPEMTGLGKRLRRKNLEIAYDLLKKPNFDFHAVRYFSRHSMLGRIDMKSIWTDFSPLPERPGLNLNSKKIGKAYSGGDYDYLYHFIDPIGRKFKVLSFDRKVYVKHLNKDQFFHYRNPHFFRYFKRRE